MQGRMYMILKWESLWGMDINISDQRGLNIEMWVGSIVRNYAIHHFQQQNHDH